MILRVLLYEYYTVFDTTDRYVPDTGVCTDAAL